MLGPAGSVDTAVIKQVFRPPKLLHIFCKNFPFLFLLCRFSCSTNLHAGARAQRKGLSIASQRRYRGYNMRGGGTSEPSEPDTAIIGHQNPLDHLPFLRLFSRCFHLSGETGDWRASVNRLRVQLEDQLAPLVAMRQEAVEDAQTLLHWLGAHETDRICARRKLREWRARTVRHGVDRSTGAQHSRMRKKRRRSMMVRLAFGHHASHSVASAFLQWAEWRGSLQRINDTFEHPQMRVLKVRLERLAKSEAFELWAILATASAQVQRAARKLLLKHALIQKWRVEYMAVMAYLHTITDRVREAINPDAAAQMKFIRRLQQTLRMHRMVIRASAHHLRLCLVRKWHRAIERKRSLQKRIDRYKDRGEEFRARARFWEGLEHIMRQVRARRRAATAFSMRAVRSAWNQWETQLMERREARLMLVMVSAKTGEHLERTKRMLNKAVPSYREQLLLQADEFGLAPLHWAAKKGQVAACELMLSFRGRLGNNATPKDLLCCVDAEGVSALHHAARAG